VSGDVVVWGGRVTFEPAGSVAGNLSVFGGGISAPAGQPLPVRGIVSTPGTLLRLYLDETHQPPWQEGGHALLSRGLRLIALSAWLAVSLVLLFCFASPFARAAASADADWPRTLLAGALGVLTLLLAAVSALALLPSPLSVPIAILFAGVAVASPAAVEALGQALRGEQTLGFACLLLLAPVVWGLRRAFARERRR